MLVPSFSVLLRLYIAHDWPHVRNQSTVGISFPLTLGSWDLMGHLTSGLYLRSSKLFPLLKTYLL